ncbi:CpsB/CapC family capsule biosynthesis tyrosine phosphatase [Acidaminobacter hydrogenoformans]|uniref:protein-tyrosine-phosphatase n=1 Tax=Acidaminobacter hydrogenoformans DSM 2784 TaxID=1120920 RepID=A0A1G5S4Y8_9FIRM|nr:CpsB/CapC family capsule biosynthesis tyrosine phosphatase [Acidaminobacter hydrogenoformans]SCZ81386.1 Tyrosine-protein phosphatase YwqE [Acidaminobacter hydrogenoformans DSM 2784]
MYDFNSHLFPHIPGDNGSKSYDMAYRMAKQTVSAGFNHVLSTSRFVAGEPFGKREDLQAVARTLSKFLRGKGMELEIVPAHKAYLNPELLQHIMNREVALLANRYLLAELPKTGQIGEALSLITELSEKNIDVVITDPEQCSAIIENPKLAVALIERGAYLQLNLNSLKHPRSRVFKTSKTLLNNQMYHFIGTDANSDTDCSPLVHNELEILINMVSRSYFDQISKSNPQRAFIGGTVENNHDSSWTSFDRKLIQPAKHSLWQRLGAAIFAQEFESF